MRTMTRLILPVAAAGVLLAGCSSGAGAGGAATAAGDTVPAVESAAPVAADVTPYPTPEEIPAPTLAPIVMNDGQGDEVVTGVVTDVIQTVLETYKDVGAYREVRGPVIVGKHVSNDVRANGKTTFAFSVDFYSKSGPMWGSMTISNDNGTWTGDCTGASVGLGKLGPLSCWLTGTGDYKGYTYYQASRLGTSGIGAITEGVIYEGTPPAK